MFILLCTAAAFTGFLWLADHRFSRIAAAGAICTALVWLYAQIAEPANTRDTVPLLLVATFAHILFPWVRGYFIDFNRHPRESENGEKV